MPSLRGTGAGRRRADLGVCVHAGAKHGGSRKARALEWKRTRDKHAFVGDPFFRLRHARQVMLYILRRMEMGVAPSGRTLLVAKKAPLLPEGGASESGGAARPRACREGRLCAGPADWYAGSPG
uniref:Uncharacterized protein n=1 Tax=Alexandrium monilatum TaxID=311494 RepID=A0A6T1H612_9DINO